MDALLWILLPGFVAVGSGLLAWFVMQSRLEVAIARERENLAEARGHLSAQRANMQEALAAAEETARRKALDEFLNDVRVEERHFVRETTQLFVKKKSMVLQERIYFRNVPLSNWVEHETVIEEGTSIDDVRKNLRAFGPDVARVEDGAAKPERKFLR